MERVTREQGGKEKRERGRKCGEGNVARDDDMGMPIAKRRKGVDVREKW